LVDKQCWALLAEGLVDKQRWALLAEGLVDKHSAGHCLQRGWLINTLLNCILLNLKENCTKYSNCKDNVY
jgi:hypothetical protein